MKKGPNPIDDNGFTLVELMIALVLSALILGAVYMTYNSQQKSYVIQEQVAATQQNLRAAMYIIQDEIRMAGYNPDSFTPAPTISSPSRDAITFQRDDGTGTTTFDNYVYTYNGANETVDRNVNGLGAQSIAENIVALGFAYAFDSSGDGDNQLDTSPNGHIIWAVDTDNDTMLDTVLDSNDDGVIDTNDPAAGTPLTGAPYYYTANVNSADIRAVKVWILAGTDRESDDFHDLGTYVLSNQRITPNNNFRHRLLTTTIRCRNLELINNS